MTDPPPAGPPRQVDVRRAISSAYYAVFHATLVAAADAYVGSTKRATGEYSLVYRRVDHRSLRQLCSDVTKQPLPPKYSRYAPHGFGSNLRTFAAALVELQEKRHSADYDPSIRVRTSDALLAVETARTALQRLRDAPDTERKGFLSLVLFQPR